MAYGVIKVDQITFTNGGIDQTVTVSGIVQSISGNITATGTIQAATIIGTSTVSGATVTGNVGQFTTATAATGIFTTQISGATVTGNTGQFTTLTGGSAGFTTVTGQTVTGTTANFSSGVFTTQISGATVTGNAGQFTTATAATGIFTTQISGATITGNAGNFTTITGGTVTLTSGVIASGTAANPSLSIVGDNNTGLYSPGADQLAISTGGTGRLFVDASGNVGVGITPANNFHVSGGALSRILVSSTSAGARTDIAFRNSASIVTTVVGFDGSNSEYDYRSGDLALKAVGIERLRVTSTGTVNIVGAGSAGSTQAISFNGSAPVNSLVVDSSGRIGLGGGTSNATNIWLSRNITGNTAQLGFYNAGVIQSDVTGVNYYFSTAAQTAASAFTLGALIHYGATQSTIGAGSAVTNQYGFYVESNLTGATNNYGFHSNIASGTNRWNFYANGTAPNYFAGNIGIGTVAPNAALHAISSTGLGIQTYSTITGGSPATSGTTDSNVLARFQGGSVLFDIGGTVAGLQWIQPRLVGDFAANYGLAICPNGGNVGIGTVSPGALLHLRSASARLFCENSSTGETAEFGVDATGALIQAGGAKSTVFYTNGSERARIDSSGRLLVGTSSALGSSSQLTVKGATNGTGGIAIARGENASTITNDEVLGVIEFTSGDNGLGAWITGQADGAWSSTSDCPTRLTFSTTADGASSPTERMRITNSGRTIAFGYTNVFDAYSAQGAGTTYELFIGGYSATSTAPGSGTTSFRVYTNGNVQNTNNSYAGISDVKLKENIVDAGSQWDDIKSLQVRKYNFKEGQTHTQIGLIAQEVELVSPGLVSESPDRDADGNDLGTVTKSVNYSVLYMKAVKALQEAMERIETLEAKVAALEGV